MRICALLGVALLALGFANAAKAVLITQHSVPTHARNIFGWSGGLIAAGITPSIMAAAVTPVPFAVGAKYAGIDDVTSIALGPNGVPWLIDLAGKASALFELASTAAVTRFILPEGGTDPTSITTGPDGAVWMAAGKSIFRYVPGGGFTSYPLPGHTYAISVAPGPDGAVWFTDLTGGIGRITASGEVAIRSIEDGDNQYGWGYMEPYGIALGPDNALWFTEQNHERIGRITAGGELQEFVIPAPKNKASSVRPEPRFIVNGPDDSMWFSDPGDSSIGRITMSGELTEYGVLTNGAEVDPDEITVGPEGVLWFTEDSANELGSLDPNANPVTTSSSQSKTARRASVRRCGTRHRRRTRSCRRRARAVRHR